MLTSGHSDTIFRPFGRQGGGIEDDHIPFLRRGRVTGPISQLIIRILGFIGSILYGARLEQHGWDFFFFFF